MTMQSFGQWEKGFALLSVRRRRLKASKVSSAIFILLHNSQYIIISQPSYRQTHTPTPTLLCNFRRMSSDQMEIYVRNTKIESHQAISEHIPIIKNACQSHLVSTILNERTQMFNTNNFALNMLNGRSFGRFSWVGEIVHSFTGRM